MKSKRALISFGSSVALTGFILSGPVGFLLVQLNYPQPEWTNAGTFVAHYNAWQNLPYYFGFVLVGGMLILAAAHCFNLANESDLDKMHVLLSVIGTAIFATLISFNYICQTTFVHLLAVHYKPEYDTAIATLSMANPASLSWAVEMWGYAILGIATWQMAAYYREKNKGIYRLLIANGVLSITSVVLFVLDDRWLLTKAGLISYFCWNFLMIILLLLIYRYSKKTEESLTANQSPKTIMIDLSKTETSEPPSQ